ncbi:hypothetical protein SARC_02016 [Sphaeroforma arctica JP610]|uniref:Uncharacterized protein n=1 Tax=Sphaeroforma arctica JP610 TaxID=667725 RepID=A0A0L0GC42_9EUKA|nr:hypothetical protein SARC_02016 [Sphaeroforma arctica JP610]KNC85833.1 hypothetical protein SARC_02016 [Sphaeroforma arctica JP610]|eukprot:XP_014159735.1 hypothetical protein SARC_02016 [Sphaeroforma arctica JP610]
MFMPANVENVRVAALNKKNWQLLKDNKERAEEVTLRILSQLGHQRSRSQVASTSDSDVQEPGIVTSTKIVLRKLLAKLMRNCSADTENLEQTRVRSRARLRKVFRIYQDPQKIPWTISIVNINLTDDARRWFVQRNSDTVLWSTTSALMYIAQLLAVLANYHGLILPINVNVLDFSDIRKAESNYNKLNFNVKCACHALGVVLYQRQEHCILLNLTRVLVLDRISFNSEPVRSGSISYDDNVAAVDDGMRSGMLDELYLKAFSPESLRIMEKSSTQLNKYTGDDWETIEALTDPEFEDLGVSRPERDHF